MLDHEFCEALAIDKKILLAMLVTWLKAYLLKSEVVINIPSARPLACYCLDTG
jgi:hypothetical protein